MEKTLRLALNRFTAIPSSLQNGTAFNCPAADITIQLVDLYLHYYLDSFGRTPPYPDPAQFEYLRFLLPIKDFRVRGDAIGASTVTRRHSSTALGQAFCRMFLHDHLGITYFAHMEHVLGRVMRPPFSSISVERVDSGDTPDYFCAANVQDVFLSEAKGRYSSISFSGKQFASWRRQFDRVVVRDASGTLRQVKGYIVATRFATESKPSVQTTLFAEDPSSPGDLSLGEDQAGDLGAAIIGLHYGEIALKLGQNVLALALSGGFTVPEDILFPVTIWELRIGPEHGMRFIGGFYPSAGGPLPLRATEKGIVYDPVAPFRLDVGSGTFFGVEEKIFRQVAAMARRGAIAAGDIQQLDEQTIPFYSGFSLLRDGCVIGPIEFFLPVAQVSF